MAGENFRINLIIRERVPGKLGREMGVDLGNLILLFLSNLRSSLFSNGASAVGIR